MISKIYLLHAPARGGKNTCADAMKEYYESRYNKKVLICAFGDYVKFVLSKYYACDDYKSLEGRTNIQHFATDQCRGINEDIWVNVISLLLEVIDDDYDICIIPDFRFKNELSFLSDKFKDKKIIPINIIRPNYKEVDNMSALQRNHISEKDLDNFKNWIYTITNNDGKLTETFQQIFNIIDNEELDE